jgi:hypothetical protein
MNRDQKIDFLTRLQAGETSIEELGALPPFGIVIKEEDGYRVQGKTMTEEELTAFLQPYQSSNRLCNGLPIIYGMLVL